MKNINNEKIRIDQAGKQEDGALRGIIWQSRFV
jgi:hypothetical protein